MIDALKYKEQLVAAHFTQKQAQTIVKILFDHLDKSLATKQDVHELEHKIHELSLDFTHKIESSEFKLTIKLGTMLAVAITLIGALVKLL
jgi:phage-related minor tail protein